MKRRNLPFNALRAFESAARHASVSGAAQELGVTHGAISHQLKLLESQLGMRLFERSNRGLQITPGGEILLPVLNESFGRIASTLAHLRTQPALAMQAASDGLGLAIGYFELIDRDLHSGRRVCASDRQVRHECSYYLVYRRSLEFSGGQSRFREWLPAQL